MKVKIKMIGGATREANAEEIHYSEDHHAIIGPFFCCELGYSQHMNIRAIHIVDIEYFT